MKYIVGSLMISFCILFVIVVVLSATGMQAFENFMTIFGIAWLVLAVLTYPLARKIIQE